MATTQAVDEQVLQVLAQVTGSDQARADPDLPLYQSGALDSFGTISLVVALEEAFGLEISPAELDVDAWATPRLLIADVERRLAARASAKR
jgi:D-alanine--poly(phosphoribitol) ligase subunit 2